MLLKLLRGRVKGSGNSQREAVTDEILIERINALDEQAMEILYHRYHARLYRFVSRITGYFGSAEEVINDVMYVVWNKADTFRRGTKLSTWIFGIAYNKALKNREQGKRTRDPSRFKTLEELDLDDSNQPIKHLEEKLWISAALAKLSPEHRASIELSYYHGMSCSEIAAVMGCNENTVKTRMFYARKKLRDILPRLADRSELEGNRL